MDSARRSGVVYAVLLVCALVCLAPASALAERFEIDGHGSLYMDLPPGWTYSIKPSVMSLPATIAFGPGNGDDFTMLVTPLFKKGGGSSSDAESDLRLMVEKEGERSLAQAAEDRLEVKKISGKQASGYYYTLTDKSLVGKKRTPGAYKYMFRSLVSIGDVMLSITLLWHDADASYINSAIGMIEGAALR